MDASDNSEEYDYPKQIFEYVENVCYGARECRCTNGFTSRAIVPIEEVVIDTSAETE